MMCTYITNVDAARVPALHAVAPMSGDGVVMVPQAALAELLGKLRGHAPVGIGKDAAVLHPLDAAGADIQRDLGRRLRRGTSCQVRDWRRRGENKQRGEVRCGKNTRGFHRFGYLAGLRKIMIYE